MRRLTGVTIAVLIGVAGVLGPSACADSVGGESSVATEVRSAQSFVDSVGVVTHFRYIDTAYRQTDELLRALSRLGVRHIRDGLPANPSPELAAVWRQLPALGIRLNLVVGSAGSRTVLPHGSRPVIAATDAGLREVVETIESANEWDLRGGQGWVDALRTFQAELYRAVKESPMWSSVPVLGPSVARKSRVADLTGMAEIMDVANLHNYAAGSPPEENLQEELDAARSNAPGKPLMVTEMGYHTAEAQVGRQAPVTEVAKADYIARTFLENYRLGVARTFVYQLIDERADPSNADQERHFGLLRHDLSETPAYATLRRLLTTLDDPGPDFVPVPVPLIVRSENDAVQHLLLQKRDGTTYVVLWRRGNDLEAGRDVTTTSAVEVTFTGGERAVTAVRPDGRASLGTTATVRENVGTSFVLLEVGRTIADPGAPNVTGSPVDSDPGGSMSVIGFAGGLVLATTATLLGFTLRRRRSAPNDVQRDDVRPD